MTDLDINASVGIDVSTAFCPKTYYAALRGLGVDPLVRKNPDGSLGEYSAVGDAGGVSAIYVWAIDGDPDWSLRREYAREAWAKRAEGEGVVLLGV